MASFLRLIQAKRQPPPDPTDVSLGGKTVLVTGATAGLGFEAAFKFLNLGVCSLIIGSRSVERGQLAKAELERRANRTDVIQVWYLDMSRFRSVVDFAERANKDILQLDAAVLNAGVLHRQYTVSSDGWEDTIQVNTLSTALLALLLLPKLRESSSDTSPSHLTLVSSGQVTRVREKDIQTHGKLLDHLNDPKAQLNMKRYGPSKLLLEYASRNIAELTRNPDGSLQVIVNTVKPGFCVSSLGREFNHFYERWAVRLFTAIFARTTEVGSRVLVSAILQGAESHGKIWKGDGYMDESGTLLVRLAGKRLQSRAWEEIIDVLKAQVPDLGDLAKY